MKKKIHMEGNCRLRRLQRGLCAFLTRAQISIISQQKEKQKKKQQQKSLIP